MGCFGEKLAVATREILQPGKQKGRNEIGIAVGHCSDARARSICQRQVCD